MNRCFIVGNGSSLNQTNLDLLVGKPSFACNRIDLIYPRTKWRPTYYVRAEAMDLSHQVWKESVETHLKMGIPCYMSGYFKENSLGYLNYHEITHCTHYLSNYGDPDLMDEWHLPWLCQFGGSLIVSMQIALLEGFDELVLLGCDLNYNNKYGSHFDKAYEHGHEQPEVFANRNNLWAHIMGINYHARRGLPYNVINATVGGDLHLYKRARLEDLV